MRIRILHLEDNPADAELIQLELSKSFERADFIVVSDKENYINALKNEKYDVILSDYNIPGILELESLEIFQNLGVDVPFIYVSGAIGEEGAVNMLKQGATDYVLKSKLEKLHIAVKRSLKYHAGRKLIKEKEQEIKEQELEYSYLIENINEGFIKLNAKGEIVLVNSAACNLLGYKKDELINKKAKSKLNISISEIDTEKAVKQNINREAAIKRKDGKEFWARLSITNQFSDTGKYTGVSIILWDYSNEKLNEVRRRVVSRIAQKLTSTQSSLTMLFQKLRDEIGEYMPNSNFFGILKEDDDSNTMVYHVDVKYELETPINCKSKSTLSHYVLREEQSIWLKGNEIAEFEKQHELSIPGIKPASIIAAPIMANDKCIGLIGCSDYDDPNTFDEFQWNLLIQIGLNIGVFIQKVEVEQARNSILQLSEDFICIVNKDGKLQYTNPAFQTSLGYGEKELKNKHVNLLISEEDSEANRTLDLMLKSKKKRHRFDSTIVNSKGEKRFVSWTAMSQEKDKSFYCIGRDFTEKRAIQKQIEESENRYRGLFQRMNEGLIRSDENGTILTVNPGICKMLGYKEGELIGKIGYELLHDTETGQRLRQKIKYRKSGKAGLYETKFLHKNGNVVWTQVSSTPDFNEKGEFIGVMSIVLNITEQKRAENDALAMKEAFTHELEREVYERTSELEKARKELAVSLKKEKELSRLKSRFVSTASHQFRTPLSVIQSSIGVLSMQIDSANGNFEPEKFKGKFDRVYGRIKEQIARMTDLMNDVLILGKINEGNIQLRLNSQPIVPVCQDILDSFTNISQRNRIELEVEGTPRELTFDKQLMEHAITNLISNAIKYSPEDKTPSVKIHFLDKVTKIKIEDEGIGIPESDLEHLFEPFYRASNAKDYSGTGLGTSIAKEYIEMQGGSINVKSQLGKGTTFTISLNN